MYIHQDSNVGRGLARSGLSNKRLSAGVGPKKSRDKLTSGMSVTHQGTVDQNRLPRQAWWGPPAWVVSQQEAWTRNMVLLPKTNWENLGGTKSKEKMPAHKMSCQSPRILCTGVHLGWGIYLPAGRTLSQNKHGPSKMTGKRQPGD